MLCWDRSIWLIGIWMTSVSSSLSHRVITCAVGIETWSPWKTQITAGIKFTCVNTCNRDLFVSLYWPHPPGKPLFSEAASQTSWVYEVEMEPWSWNLYKAEIVWHGSLLTNTNPIKIQSVIILTVVILSLLMSDFTSWGSASEMTNVNWKWW